MGYIAQGAAKSATSFRSVETLFSQLKCGEGKEWVPPANGQAGYCRRLPSTSGTTATVTQTPADAIRERCNRFGFGSEKARICEEWLRAGKPEAQLASVFACLDAGYTGQSFELCLDGRTKGASFTEIDTVITELATQAGAAQAAQLAQEQAMVASQRRRTYLILGGLAAAGVVGYLVWKKRKAKKPQAPKAPTAA